MRAALLAFFLALPANAAPVAYLDAAFGLTEQGPDLAGSLDHARTLGRFAAGIEWRGLYIEIDHISDVQERDRGMNTLWFGMRREFQLR